MEGIAKSIDLRMTELDDVKGKEIFGISSTLDEPRISSRDIKELVCYPEEKEFYSSVVKEKKKVGYKLFLWIF